MWKWLEAVHATSLEIFLVPYSKHDVVRCVVVPPHEACEAADAMVRDMRAIPALLLALPACYFSLAYVNQLGLVDELKH